VPTPPYIYSLWFFLSWLPSYLIEYRKFTLIKTGHFLLRCLLLPVLWEMPSAAG